VCIIYIGFGANWLEPRLSACCWPSLWGG